MTPPSDAESLLIPALKVVQGSGAQEIVSQK